jgi:hypothetical protein
VEIMICDIAVALSAGLDWGGVAALLAQQSPAPATDQTRNALLALAIGGAAVLSSLAFGIAMGIRRQIDQIAPPEDEDE